MFSNEEIEEKIKQKKFNDNLQILYSLNSSESIYAYALYFTNPTTIEMLADDIIKINDAEYITNFAKDIFNAPIEKLADVIIKTNNIEKYIILQ